MIRHILNPGLVRSDAIAWLPGNAVPSLNMPAGAIVQRVAATPYTTYATLGTIIPSDDTIPTATEGTQILTLSLTAKQSTNKVLLRFQGFGTLDGVAALVAAIYKDGTGVAATAVGVNAAGSLRNVILEHEDSPGDTSAHTYTVRVGASSGNAFMNGIDSARRFGGVAACTLVAEEVQV